MPVPGSPARRRSRPPCGHGLPAGEIPGLPERSPVQPGSESAGQGASLRPLVTSPVTNSLAWSTSSTRSSLRVGSPPVKTIWGMPLSQSFVNDLFPFGGTQARYLSGDRRYSRNSSYYCSCRSGPDPSGEGQSRASDRSLWSPDSRPRSDNCPG